MIGIQDVAINQYNCGGEITDIGFHFWGDGRGFGCGNPDLHLLSKGNFTFIEIKNVTYRVLSVDTVDRSIKLPGRTADCIYMDGICSPNLLNTTLDSNIFVYGSGYGNISCSFSWIGNVTSKMVGFLILQMLSIRMEQKRIKLFDSSLGIFREEGGKNKHFTSSHGLKFPS